MNAILVKIGRKHVPLKECDWVVFKPCGCPTTVMLAQYDDSEALATESQAWDSLLDDLPPAKRRKEIERRLKAGFRMELVTHQRWKDEIVQNFVLQDPHEEGA